MISFFSKKKWTLHNPLKGWTRQGLSLEEAQLLVSTLSMGEQAVTMIWVEEWPEWKELRSSEGEVLFMERDSAGSNPPPLPDADVDEVDEAAEEEEITQVRPVNSTKRTSIAARKFERIEISIPCELIVGGYSFPTHTKDISLGGFCFEDSLPEWVAGYFTVSLKTSEPLEFICTLVEDQKRNKLRASIVLENQEEVIEKLRLLMVSL